jgi:hypothetical protein
MIAGTQSHQGAERPPARRLFQLMQGSTDADAGRGEYSDRSLIGRLVYVRAVITFKLRHILPFFLGFDLQDFNGTAARRRLEP